MVLFWKVFSLTRKFIEVMKKKNIFGVIKIVWKNKPLKNKQTKQSKTKNKNKRTKTKQNKNTNKQTNTFLINGLT